MQFQPLVDFVENQIRGVRGIPGFDVQVMRNHEVLFRYSSGTSDKFRQKPVSPKDLYYIYSCTKPMTCAAALQLVEQGKLNLEDPVAKYLPAYSQAFLMRNGEKVPPKNTMTIRHLFTMSAGLDYAVAAKPIVDLVAANPNATTRQLAEAFVESPLSFEPGFQFQYSLCHDVLAAVVEVVSGLRFSDYLRENIWEPLGMQRVGFHPTEEQEKDLVWHFKYDKAAGAIVPKDNCNLRYRLSAAHESGGAGLFCSVDDYALFADAMACGGVGKTGNRILKPETIDLMRTDQNGRYTKKEEDPTGENSGYNYGLGVRTLVDKSNGQRSALGEFGWDGAAGAYTLMDPTYGISIFSAMSVTGWHNIIEDQGPLRDTVYECLGIE